MGTNIARKNYRKFDRITVFLSKPDCQLKMKRVLGFRLMVLNYVAANVIEVIEQAPLKLQEQLKVKKHV